MLASAVVVAVALVAAAVVVIALRPHNGSAGTDASGPIDSTVLSDVTGVPAAALDSVGAGAATAYPKALTGQPALTAADGKPRVLYVGAEYCPYCAAERWPMVVALSRFGTFSGLAQTASSSTDVFPSTATLSFHGASYSSSYLSFTGVETEDRQGKALDTLTAADQKTFGTYDYPPYVAGSNGAIPFVDLGGKYVVSGASYDPQVLHGLTHAQIASDLADPTSAVAKSVDGTANVITAALCNLTGGQPAAVCTSSGVTAATSKLGS